MSESLKKLKEIYTNYSFIYASDFAFQFNTEFQEWRKLIDVPILCPSRESSFLEFSKLKLKGILKELQIPNPDYEIVIEDDWGRIEDLKNPKFLTDRFMLKMDKNSIVFSGHQSRISNFQSYKKSIHQTRHLSGSYFVEEYINGTEASAHFLCNGNDWLYLGSARDYKKLYENDQGQNCSSTGSYSPVSYITENVKSQMFSYMTRILAYLNLCGVEYKGVMYLGLMIDSTETVNILEINTRPGNPEFNTIVTTIKSGLLENLQNAALGFPFTAIEFDNTIASVSINILNENYLLENKQPITAAPLLLDNTTTICYFDPAVDGNNMFANVLKTDKNLSDAATSLNRLLKDQLPNGCRFRQDIGILK
jgi:phosphoribosylamine-glycine ligase